MARPLEGAEVIVTRPFPEGERLARAIATAGGRPLLAPLLQIEPLPVGKTLPEGEIWIYVSRNAVRASQRLLPPKGVKIGAIGPGTAEELERLGLKVDLCPPPPYTSENLLELLKGVGGRRFVLVCGLGGRRLLEKTLRERGAQLVRLEVYRRLPPREEVLSNLRRWLREGRRMVVVTSGEILQNLVRAAPEAVDHPICVVSRRLSEEAHRFGFREIITAPSARDGEIVEALAAWWQRDGDPL